MLVTMKEILDHASAGNYAVAAPDIVSEFDARAFIEAAEECNAPLIIDVEYNSITDIFFIGQMLRQMAMQSSVPIAINLDHGKTRQQVMEAIQAGFTAVMIDRSASPYEENVKDVKEIVELAHSVGISVEAELGHVGQADNYANDRDAALTDPEQARRFVEETGVDCLAVAIGTAHGAYPKGFEPYLDYDRLEQIKKAVGSLPLVLHGSSGSSYESLRKVCSMGINKVNISNDLRKAVVSSITDAYSEEGGNAYLVFKVAKQAMKDKLKEMIEIYGSCDKAWISKGEGLPKKETYPGKTVR